MISRIKAVRKGYQEEEAIKKGHQNETVRKTDGNGLVSSRYCSCTRVLSCNDYCVWLWPFCLITLHVLLIMPFLIIICFPAEEINLLEPVSQWWWRHICCWHLSMSGRKRLHQRHTSTSTLTARGTMLQNKTHLPTFHISVLISLRIFLADPCTFRVYFSLGFYSIIMMVWEMR